MVKMKPSLSFVVFLSSICLNWIQQVDASDSSFEQTKECSTYSDKLVSFPDLHNMIRYKGRRQAGFEIDSVKNTNRERSFYWCELDIEETDTIYKRYRHYGFNSTHWWVEKGCGGWFWVTECRPTVTSSSSTAGGRKNPPGEHFIRGTEDDEDDDDNEISMQDNNLPLSQHHSVDKISANLAASVPTSGGQLVGRVPSGHALISAKGAPEQFHPSPMSDNYERTYGGPNTNAAAGFINSLQHLPSNGEKEMFAAHPTSAMFPDRVSPSVMASSNSSIDDIYKGWPLMGYEFPTSSEMWELLDRATWVDVKAQLGFYAKYGGRNSDIFD